MILRVGHLRDCEYELQQHRRYARSRGVGPELQAKIFEGPDAEGLTDRQRALITATDEFVITRGRVTRKLGGIVGPSEQDSAHRVLPARSTIRRVAATISTLQIPLDYPD